MTRALMDTHAFLWFVNGDERLSQTARRLIEPFSNQILLSVASLWEIAIKVNIGKLTLARPFGELIPHGLHHQRIEVLPISIANLTTLTTLPLHHRDPFDRLIIVQALNEELPIISADEAFDAYGVRRIR